MAQKEADVKKMSMGVNPSASAQPAVKQGTFNYGAFYEVELEKKHQDK